MTVDLSADATLPARDVARLRRMKQTATGFLGAAAAVFVATYFVHPGLAGDAGVIGFVRAGAEAAMVGGLADWFAVTALFRHPLGLPIPHTAIIPENKDDIATKLGTFVTGNFLTPELMTGHLARAQVVPKLGRWLQEPANAAGLAAEVSHAAAVALEELDEDALFAYVLEVARRDINRRSYAPIVGQILGRVVEVDAQRPLVGLLAARSHEYLRTNRETVRPQLKVYLEEKNILVGWLATDKRLDRLIDFALRELRGIEHDPAHPLRARLDDLLASFAHDLETDPATMMRLDLAWRRLLEDEQFQTPVRRFIEGAADSLRASLADETSGLSARVSQAIQDIGHRIATDREFASRLEAWLHRSVIYAVEEYGDEFTVLIQRTVAEWDASSAARRIEVAVGRDLQFIRINGTVVGAIAGLGIHALGIVLS
jgi:uncharacterized membrane-anchored protein YjiN (DUF445 family)